MPSKDAPFPDYEYAMTLEQIGQVLGISKQAVEQIESRALRRIRESGLMDDFRELVANEKRRKEHLE